jgi:hypothetical protein
MGNVQIGKDHGQKNYVKKDQDMHDDQEEKELTFAEFLLEKAKKMFGTDDLNNDDVCEYFISNLKKFDKTVEVLEDDIDCINSHVVAYQGEDDEYYYCLFAGDKKGCIKYCEDNGLKIQED